MKARFNNIMGQIQHIRGNYTEAIRYYLLAAGKGLPWNEISLAQAYINPNAVNYIEAIKVLEDTYRTFEGKDSRVLNDSFKLMAYLKSKVPPRTHDEKGA